VTHVLRDLRFAVRLLTRKPVFAVAAVLTAALGIGVTTAMFSVVNGVVLRPLPYAEADELVYLGVRGSGPMPFFATSMPDFLDWHDRLGSFQQVGAMEPVSLVVALDGEATRFDAARMSPEVMPMFRMVPHFGRLFSEDEYLTGTGSVALLSYDLWKRWGADPDIVGRKISMVGDSEDLMIVGVMPGNFEAPAATRMKPPELWLPLPVDGSAYDSSRTDRTLRVIGRLAPGVTLDEARGETEALAVALASDFPDAYMVSETSQLTIGVAPLHEQTIGRTGNVVLILLGATGLLLLIGCANNANLLLARAVDRKLEIALRFSLGADRRRVFSQLMTESVLLGTLGGVVGIAMALVLVRLLHVVGPTNLPRLAEVAIDQRALWFALAVSLMTAILFGLVPALMTSGVNPAIDLKGAGNRTSAGTKNSLLPRVLVVAETALALVLLSGAGLLAASFFNLQRVDPGFKVDGLRTVSIGLTDEYAPDHSRVGYLGELANEVGAVPGVESVSFISTLPINGFDTWAPDILLEGADLASINGFIGLIAGVDYFETMGIRILAGRGITARDDEAGIKVAAVSETAAGRLWPGEDPIGKRFKLSNAEAPWVTVVGMVADVRTVGLSEDSSGEIYLPHSQNPWPDWMHAVVRGQHKELNLAGRLREIMKRLSPNIPFDGLLPLSARMSTSVNHQKFNAFMWVMFGATALLLSAVGIYATLLNQVGRRTREIGIRVALGATPSQMFRMVIREGVVLTGCGALIGLAATLAFSRLLASFLFGITATDPVTLAVACSVLAAVALLACYVPARRATKADPMLALRAN
jgi:putative ABC transport system permease protein